jgi:hypothetical protein
MQCCTAAILRPNPAISVLRQLSVLPPIAFDLKDAYWIDRFRRRFRNFNDAQAHGSQSRSRAHRRAPVCLLAGRWGAAGAAIGLPTLAADTREFRFS